MVRRIELEIVFGFNVTIKVECRNNKFTFSLVDVSLFFRFFCCRMNFYRVFGWLKTAVMRVSVMGMDGEQLGLLVDRS
jgi:hypothetical protein